MQSQNIKTYKVYSVIIGVAITLLFIECCLSLVGLLYKWHYKIKQMNLLKAKAMYRILCVGDSFTYGLGAKGYGNSYPMQLQQLLNQYCPGRFKVDTIAEPGLNSATIYEMLKKNFGSHKPDMAIVLCGINDEWNIENVDLDSVNCVGKIVPGYLYKMKTCKLIALMCQNLRHRKDKAMRLLAVDNKNDYHKISQIDKESLYYFDLANKAFNEGKIELAKERCEQALKLDRNNFLALWQLGEILRHLEKFNAAEENLFNSLAIAPDYIPSHLALICLYFTMGDYNKSYLKEIELLRKFKLSHDQLVKLIQAAVLTLNAENMRHEFIERINLIETIVKDRYQFEYDSYFKKMIKMLKLMHEENSRLFFMIEKNMQEIINLLSGNNVVTVLLNYPSPQSDKYAFLMRNIAAKNDVIFIDNYVFFEKMLKSAAEKDFFIPDGHCNATGYKLLAENIFRVLRQEGLI